MQFPVAKIVVRNRVRKDFGDLRALASSINELGLLQPIGITKDRELVFGERRLRAVRDILQWPAIPVREVNLEAIILGEHAENELRKDFTPSERVEIGKKIEAYYGERRGNPNLIVENFPQLAGQKTRDIAAERAGFGNARTYEQARKVAEQGAPELVEAMDGGAASISAAAEVATLPVEEQKVIVAKGETEILKAAKEIRAKRTEERRQERVTKIAELSEATILPLVSLGRYPIILADPPWRYDFSKDDADEIENQYPTQTIEEICAHPVVDVALDDCVLFLWTTSPKLEESFEVIKAWGFQYRTCAIWDKAWIGPGYYFRQRHELLLIATRGAVPVPRPADRPDSIFVEKRTEHSKKPELAYRLIESMYPELPKLELFARSAREGWAAWGNEAGKAVAQ